MDFVRPPEPLDTDGPQSSSKRLEVDDPTDATGIPFSVFGFHVFGAERSVGYAGSAILVQHSIPFSQIPLPSLSSTINAAAIRAFNISYFPLTPSTYLLGPFL